jgi:hypothetical protein
MGAQRPPLFGGGRHKSGGYSKPGPQHHIELSGRVRADSEVEQARESLRAAARRASPWERVGSTLRPMATIVGLAAALSALVVFLLLAMPVIMQAAVSPEMGQDLMRAKGSWSASWSLPSLKEDAAFEPGAIALDLGVHDLRVLGESDSWRQERGLLFN